MAQLLRNVLVKQRAIDRSIDRSIEVGKTLMTKRSDCLHSHAVQLLGGPAGLQPLQERRPEVQLRVVCQAQGLRVRKAVHGQPAGLPGPLQRGVPQPRDHRRE